MSKDQAILHKCDSLGRRQWTHSFKDWHTGDAFSETIVAADTDSSDNIYCFAVAWYRNGENTYDFTRLHKFTSAGVLLWTKQNTNASGDPTIGSLSCAPSGYFVYNNTDTSVVARDNDGIALWTKTGLNYVYSVELGADGFIYVRDEDGLYKLDSAGETIWFCSIGGGGGG